MGSDPIPGCFQGSVSNPFFPLRVGSGSGFPDGRGQFFLTVGSGASSRSHPDPGHLNPDPTAGSHIAGPILVIARGVGHAINRLTLCRMVLILDGSSEIGAHVSSEIGYLV